MNYRGLCHLLPSTPCGTLRKEEVIKADLLQTSKTDNYCRRQPPSAGALKCAKAGGSLSGLTEKTKLSKAAMLMDYTGASRINSNQGKDCGHQEAGTGRRAPGGGSVRHLPQ